MFALRNSGASTRSKKAFFVGVVKGEVVFGTKADAKTWKGESAAYNASDKLFDKHSVNLDVVEVE